jgi:glycosyltransferase involved in cell wall biosynthesis
VKSPFSIFSGYGQDGFGLVRGLMRWGCDVYVQPVWLDTPVPRDILPVFGKTLTPPFDVTINHWAPPNIELGESPRKATRLAVAWSMWEFQEGKRKGSAFHGFPEAHQSTFRERLRWFDLLLGYDPVSLTAMEPYAPKHAGKGLLQGGYPSEDWKPVERDWFSDRFGFVMHGMLNGRKQPWLVIQAFNELRAEHKDFAKNATLTLHNLAGGIPDELNDIMPKVKVLQQVMDHDTLLDMYRYNHVLLAPSLGEGKNLPALEMMSTGGTVIATNVGGHTMWMRGDIAYGLPWKPTPLYPKLPDGPQVAQVALEDLKEAMWHAYTHREEARNKGQLASKLIPQQCDWSVVVENLFRRCRDLVPHNGELVYQMAQECQRAAAPAFAPGGLIAR